MVLGLTREAELQRQRQLLTRMADQLGKSAELLQVYRVNAAEAGSALERLAVDVETAVNELRATVLEFENFSLDQALSPDGEALVDRFAEEVRAFKAAVQALKSSGEANAAQGLGEWERVVNGVSASLENAQGVSRLSQAVSAVQNRSSAAVSELLGTLAVITNLRGKGRLKAPRTRAGEVVDGNLSGLVHPATPAVTQEGLVAPVERVAELIDALQQEAVLDASGATAEVRRLVAQVNAAVDQAKFAAATVTPRDDGAADALKRAMNALDASLTRVAQAREEFEYDDREAAMVDQWLAQASAAADTAARAKKLMREAGNTEATQSLVNSLYVLTHGLPRATVDFFRHGRTALAAVVDGHRVARAVERDADGRYVDRATSLKLANDRLRSVRLAPLASGASSLYAAAERRGDDDARRRLGAYERVRHDAEKELAALGRWSADPEQLARALNSAVAAMNSLSGRQLTLNRQATRFTSRLLGSGKEDAGDLRGMTQATLQSITSLLSAAESLDVDTPAVALLREQRRELLNSLGLLDKVSSPLEDVAKGIVSFRRGFERVRGSLSRLLSTAGLGVLNNLLFPLKFFGDVFDRYAAQGTSKYRLSLASQGVGAGVDVEANRRTAYEASQEFYGHSYGKIGFERAADFQAQFLRNVGGSRGATPAETVADAEYITRAAVDYQEVFKVGDSEVNDFFKVFYQDLGATAQEAVARLGRLSEVAQANNDPMSVLLGTITTLAKSLRDELGLSAAHAIGAFTALRSERHLRVEDAADLTRATARAVNNTGQKWSKSLFYHVLTGKPGSMFKSLRDNLISHDENGNPIDAYYENLVDQLFAEIETVGGAYGVDNDASMGWVAVAKTLREQGYTNQKDRGQIMAMLRSGEGDNKARREKLKEQLKAIDEANDGDKGANAVNKSSSAVEAAADQLSELTKTKATYYLGVNRLANEVDLTLKGPLSTLRQWIKTGLDWLTGRFKDFAVILRKIYELPLVQEGFKLFTDHPIAGTIAMLVAGSVGYGVISSTFKRAVAAAPAFARFLGPIGAVMALGAGLLAYSAGSGVAHAAPAADNGVDQLIDTLTSAGGKAPGAEDLVNPYLTPAGAQVASTAEGARVAEFFLGGTAVITAVTADGWPLWAKVALGIVGAGALYGGYRLYQRGKRLARRAYRKVRRAVRLGTRPIRHGLAGLGGNSRAGRLLRGAAALGAGALAYFGLDKATSAEAAPLEGDDGATTRETPSPTEYPWQALWRRFTGKGGDDNPKADEAFRSRPKVNALEQQALYLRTEEETFAEFASRLRISDRELKELETRSLSNHGIEVGTLTREEERRWQHYVDEYMGIFNSVLSAVQAASARTAANRMAPVRVSGEAVTEDTVASHDVHTDSGVTAETLAYFFKGGPLEGHEQEFIDVCRKHNYDPAYVAAKIGVEHSFGRNMGGWAPYKNIMSWGVNHKTLRNKVYSSYLENIDFALGSMNKMSVYTNARTIREMGQYYDPSPEEHWAASVEEIYKQIVRRQGGRLPGVSGTFAPSGGQPGAPSGGRTVSFEVTGYVASADPMEGGWGTNSGVSLVNKTRSVHYLASDESMEGQVIYFAPEDVPEGMEAGYYVVVDTGNAFKGRPDAVDVFSGDTNLGPEPERLANLIGRRRGVKGTLVGNRRLTRAELAEWDPSNPNKFNLGINVGAPTAGVPSPAPRTHAPSPGPRPGPGPSYSPAPAPLSTEPGEYFENALPSKEAWSNMTPEARQFINELTRRFYEETKRRFGKGARVTITSGWRGYDTNGGGSKHPKGRAFDVVADEFSGPKGMEYRQLYGQLAAEMGGTPLDEYPGGAGEQYAHGSNYHVTVPEGWKPPTGTAAPVGSTESPQPARQLTPEEKYQEATKGYKGKKVRGRLVDNMYVDATRQFESVADIKRRLTTDDPVRELFRGYVPPSSSVVDYPTPSGSPVSTPSPPDAPVSPPDAAQEGLSERDRAGTIDKVMQVVKKWAQKYLENPGVEADCNFE